MVKKLRIIISAKGGQVIMKSDGPPIRQSLSDGSLDTMTRKPADSEEVRWMAQEVRGYCEAVLNSLAANVPKAVVLCQVEKAKEEMLRFIFHLGAVYQTLTREIFDVDLSSKIVVDVIDFQMGRSFKIHRVKLQEHFLKCHGDEDVERGKGMKPTEWNIK